MKISVPNVDEFSARLRGMLEKSGYAVSTASPDYVLWLEPRPQAGIVLDGVDGELEHLAARYISELSKTPISLQRAGGIQNDRQLCIKFSVKEGDAVTTGLYRAIAAVLFSSAVPQPQASAPGSGAPTFSGSFKVDFSQVEILASKFHDLIAILKVMVERDEEQLKKFEQIVQDRANADHQIMLADLYLTHANEISDMRSVFKRAQDESNTRSLRQAEELQALRARFLRIDAMTWWKRLFYWNE